MTNLKNSVRLIGFVGQEPEIKTTDHGKKVATLSLATNDSYKDAEGQKISETMWHNLVIWGKLAELAEKYLSKGAEIAIEGKLMNRNYVAKDGTKRYITEILVNDLHMISSRKLENQTDQQNQPVEQSESKPKSKRHGSRKEANT